MPLGQWKKKQLEKSQKKDPGKTSGGDPKKESQAQPNPVGIMRAFKSHTTISYKEAKSLPSRTRKESLQKFYGDEKESEEAKVLLKENPRHKSIDEVFPEIQSVRRSQPVDQKKPIQDADSIYYSEIKVPASPPQLAARRSTISTGSPVSKEFMARRPFQAQKAPSSPEIVTDMRTKLSGTKVVMRGSTDRYQIVENRKQVVNLETEFKLLLEDPKKLALFETFVFKEMSGEALSFWKEAEAFCKTDWKKHDIRRASQSIFKKFLETKCPYPINVDSTVRDSIRQDMKDPHRFMFQEVQAHIFELMKNDSFRRFRITPQYLAALEHEQYEALASLRW